MTQIEEAMERMKGAKAKQETNIILHVPGIHKIATTAEKQEIIQKAVADVRKYVADIGGHMLGLVTRIRGIQTASPEVRAIYSKEFRALEEEVLAHINSDEELLASAARRAYALAMVATLPVDKRLVVETIKGSKSSRLPGLIEIKMLDPVSVNADLKIFGDSFRVIGNREFTQKITNGLFEGASRAAKAAHDLYHSEVANLKSRATITVAEMLEGKIGSFFLAIPDVKDEFKFLPGGSLLAESDGRAIKVAKVCGHFQRVMTEIAEAGTFVSVDSLGRGRLELAKRLSDDKFKQARILHAVLRRGIATL